MKNPSNIFGDSNDENNLPHTFLVTNAQVSRLCKAFPNNSSANIKLSETQLFKIGQSGGFLGKLLGPLLKTVLPLIGNILKLLDKSDPIRINSISNRCSYSYENVWIRYHPPMLALYPVDLAKRITLIILNEEMNIMKIVKSLEKSGVLIKSISKAIKNEAKEQKGGFLSMLISTVVASLSGNLLTGKGKIRAAEGTVRSGQDFQCSLIL